MKIQPNIKMLINAIIIGTIVNPIFSKVLLKVYIYNYKNNEDTKHDGNKCEAFHWANDHCDPIYEICITEKNFCDVYKTTTKVFDNSKMVYNVFTQTLERNTFTHSVSISVRVDDSDSGGLSDHIAKFNARFNIERPNFIYNKAMSVEPSNLKVSLQASVSIKCAFNYQGNTCEERSDERLCNSTCINGKCKLDIQKDVFVCQCYNGWHSRDCNKSTYTSSTKVSTGQNFKWISTKYNRVVNVSSFDFSTTIIIICLIIVLCISLFSMIYVIRTTKKRNKKSLNLFSPPSRPLPAITFSKNQIKYSHDQNTIKSQFTEPDNAYESCTIQIGDSFHSRNSNKQNLFEIEDPYEVPLISTIETIVNSVEDEYEVPICSESLRK